MNKDLQDGMQCSQFEALLADALDVEDAKGDESVDLLSPAMRKAFDDHKLNCPVCAPLFAEAHEGMLLLRAVAELDPPRNLVHNILAATSRAERAEKAASGAKVQAGWLERLRRSMRPSLAGLLHSRFAASFCMAFFSLSLTLTLAGVKISDLSKIDWHPNALRKSVVLEYTQIEAKVMRYYDNMRLVYEVQNRVQQLKKSAAPAQNDNNKDNIRPEQQNRNHAPGTGRPEQEENYSQERDGSLIAHSMMKQEGVRL